MEVVQMKRDFVPLNLMKWSKESTCVSYDYCLFAEYLHTVNIFVAPNLWKCGSGVYL